MVALCNGVVRSGSTLQYNIARLVVEKLDLGCGRARLQELVEQGVVPRPEGPDLASTRLPASSRIYVFHAHYLSLPFPNLDHAAELGNGGQLKVLFVHRDLRDVLASMKRTWKMKWSECAAMLDRTRDNYAFVRRHQDEEWLLVQAYETLTADLPAAVGEIASTLGVSLAEETRVEIAHECSIGRAETVTRDVRRQMVQNRDDLLDRGLAREQMADQGRVFQDRDTLLLHNHISPARGASGVWREQLAAHEVQQLMERYGSWMEELGYG